MLVEGAGVHSIYRLGCFKIEFGLQHISCLGRKRENFRTRKSGGGGGLSDKDNNDHLIREPNSGSSATRRRHRANQINQTGRKRPGFREDKQMSTWMFLRSGACRRGLWIERPTGNPRRHFESPPPSTPKGQGGSINELGAPGPLIFPLLAGSHHITLGRAFHVIRGSEPPTHCNRRKNKGLASRRPQQITSACHATTLRDSVYFICLCLRRVGQPTAEPELGA
jgi:hypothetical protein